MKVPLLDLTEQNRAIEHELKAAFGRVLESGRFIQGAEGEALETALAEYTRTRHAITVSSGTDALLVSLMALGIGSGDEVICPSFTFFATAGAVWRTGAKPVFVDCCTNTFNVSPDSVKQAVTSKTKAIIPVHLFGQTADMTSIMEIADECDLPVIEDAAQALGSRHRGEPAGSIGNMGTFSFFPSKNLGGFGEGGAITTNNDKLAHECRLLRNHGMEPRYYHSIVGGNFRCDEIQSALLRVKLAYLDKYTQKRCRNAEFYREHLAEWPEELILPTVLDGNQSIWNQFTVRVPGEGRRDALRNHLASLGVASEVYYPVPLHHQECFQSAVPSSCELPVTDKLAAQVLSLPVFPELTAEQRERVVESARAFFES